MSLPSAGFAADFLVFARYGPALRRDRPRCPLPADRLPLAVLDGVESALSAIRRPRSG